MSTSEENLSFYVDNKKKKVSNVYECKNISKILTSRFIFLPLKM